MRNAEKSDRTATQIEREPGLRINQLNKWGQQPEQKQDIACLGKGRLADQEVEIRRLKVLSLLKKFLCTNRHKKMSQTRTLIGSTLT